MPLPYLQESANSLLTKGIPEFPFKCYSRAILLKIILFIHMDRMYYQYLIINSAVVLVHDQCHLLPHRRPVSSRPSLQGFCFSFWLPGLLLSGLRETYSLSNVFQNKYITCMTFTQFSYTSHQIIRTIIQCSSACTTNNKNSWRIHSNSREK